MGFDTYGALGGVNLGRRFWGSKATPIHSRPPQSSAAARVTNLGRARSAGRSILDVSRDISVEVRQTCHHASQEG
jgi:hypothetical protein